MNKLVHCLYIICLFLLSSSTFAQTNQSIEVQIKTSKTLGLYEFTLGIAGKGYGSQTLTEIFAASEFHTEEAGRFLASLSDVDLSYDYKFSDLVKHRFNNRQITQLLTMAAAHSKDLADFRQRTFGLLPNKSHDKLFAVLEFFLPIYETLVWKPSKVFLTKNLEALNSAARKHDLSAYFSVALHFYQSQWNSATPFEVFVLPIPSKRGYSFATPQGNVLSLSVLDGQDIEGQLSIIFHELSHILYANQPIELQQQLENTFLTLPSVFKSHAYQIFDEALATAIGNGWFLKKVVGKLDDEDWYHSKYINHQAKAIYPLVAEYLEKGKSIDKQFIQHFVEQYAVNFPDSHLEVENALANTTILCERDGCPEGKIAEVFFKHLKFLRSFHTLEPTDSLEKQSEFLQSITTQIAILNRKNEEYLDAIAKQLNWVSTLSPPTNGDYIMANLSEGGSVQLVLVLNDSANLENAIVTLLKQSKLSGQPELILIK